MFLTRHLEKLSPFKFCLIVTLESVIISALVGIIISIFQPLPYRNFIDSPAFHILLFGGVIIPIIETILFQAIPIKLIKLLKGNLTFQIIFSTLLFTIAHFMVDWRIGLSVGLVAGYYLAFSYAFWLKTNFKTAFYVTAASHIIRNLFALGLVIILTPKIETIKISYDSFTHPKYGSAWHFMDQDGEFLFAIVDTGVSEYTKLSRMHNTLFQGRFILQYGKQTHSFYYNSTTNFLIINKEELSLEENNVIFIDSSLKEPCLDACYIELVLEDHNSRIGELRMKLQELMMSPL